MVWNNTWLKKNLFILACYLALFSRDNQNYDFLNLFQRYSLLIQWNMFYLYPLLFHKGSVPWFCSVNKSILEIVPYLYIKSFFNHFLNTCCCKYRLFRQIHLESSSLQSELLISSLSLARVGQFNFVVWFLKLRISCRRAAILVQIYSLKQTLS